MESVFDRLKASEKIDLRGPRLCDTSGPPKGLFDGFVDHGGPTDPPSVELFHTRNEP